MVIDEIDNMTDSPLQSEIYIFNTFTTRSMGIQGQLHTGYKRDLYLRDRP